MIVIRLYSSLLSNYKTFIQKKLFVCIFLFVFVMNSVSAQNVKYLVESGDKYFAAKNYIAASDNYKKAIKLNENIIEIYYKYAQSCRLSRNYTEAEKWYKKTIKENSIEFPLSGFWLAECQKYQAKYKLASKSFIQFYENYELENDFYKLKSKYEAEVCENHANVEQIDEKKQVQKLDTVINSDYSEFNVFEYDDSTIIFSSLLTNSNELDNYCIKYFKIDKNKLRKSTFFENEENVCEITHICFSSDKKTIYFTKRLTLKEEKQSKIYRANFNNGKIENQKMLSENVNFPESNSIHPFITNFHDQEFLIFSSDREGGFGKFDLYSCQIFENGKTGNCQNLGNQINSIDDEISPFYFAGDTNLFFSSKWHGSFGGFDVYKSKGDFSIWEIPENYGHSVNSSLDDLYFSFNNSTKISYFVSNRGKSSIFNKYETCCNDAYSLKLPETHNDTVRHILKMENLFQGLCSYLPLNLYFDNNQPNPQNEDTTTNLSYETLVLEYLNQVDIYKQEFCDDLQDSELEVSMAQIDSFFGQEVKKGYYDLLRFFEDLVELLENGKTIEISLKAYASPLNSAEYNIKLSKRRIVSLKNFMREYKNSSLAKYFENPDASQLTIIEQPFGESKSPVNISDDINDLKNSVYNPLVAKERKISITLIEMK
jgi:hypothetical protein